MEEGSFGKDGDATQTEQKWILLKLSILICLEIRKVAGVAAGRVQGMRDLLIRFLQTSTKYQTKRGY